MEQFVITNALVYTGHRFAPREVYVENGRVAEQGTPAELMERGGLYRRMVELQSESARWQLG